MVVGGWGMETGLRFFFLELRDHGLTEVCVGVIVKDHDGGTKARVGFVHIQEEANARGGFRKRAHPKDSPLFGGKARPEENVPIALVAPDLEGERVAREALTRHVVH